MLCFVLAGALLGFLRWNFHPAKIFSGTSGVQFVGYTLAVLSILGTAKVAVALLVLGVPIIDTFWIIVRRLSQRRSPFTPDRQHIHHRLLDLGLSHRQTVLVIYGVCAALAVLALVLTGASLLYTFLVVFIAAGLVLFLPIRGDFGRPDELEAEAYEPNDGDGPSASRAAAVGSPAGSVLASPRHEPGTWPRGTLCPGHRQAHRVWHVGSAQEHRRADRCDQGYAGAWPPRNRCRHRRKPNRCPTGPTPDRRNSPGRGSRRNAVDAQSPGRNSGSRDARGARACPSRRRRSSSYRSHGAG